MLFVLAQKAFPRRGFVLKPIERLYVPLKTVLGIFKLALRLRSAIFHVTTTEDFHHFRCINFETIFLKN